MKSKWKTLFPERLRGRALPVCAPLDTGGIVTPGGPLTGRTVHQHGANLKADSSGADDSVGEPYRRGEGVSDDAEHEFCSYCGSDGCGCHKLVFAKTLRPSGTCAGLCLASVVLAAIVGLALAACGTMSNGSAVAAATNHQAVSTKDPVAVTAVTAKACVDATASSDREFADGVRQALASAVATWVPVLPAGTPTTAEPAVPALTLWVRQVLTNSYSTQSPSLELQIPAIPALPAPPQLTDPNLATDQLTWTSREQAWRKATTQALKQEAAAVTALKGYPLDHNARNWSAISGCMAALAGQGTQDASTRMLLASDLQENRPAVTANYVGAAMLIDQNCPWTAQSCTTRAASWTTRFRRQAMGSVAMVRADGAAQAIQNWLLGGRS